MPVTLSGIVMQRRLLQEAKALDARLVTPVPMVTFVKPEQEAKALLPMLVMLSGSVMLNRLLHE
jgi:hypothetical protein